MKDVTSEITQLENELKEIKKYNMDKKEWERKPTQGLEFKIKMKIKKMEGLK